MRAIGHASHFVDLERGVRRNGKLIASDIHEQIDTIRTIAHQEGLSQACLDRIEKAARVVPTRQATIAFVSGYVRQQVSRLELTPPQSYAMHAHFEPGGALGVLCPVAQNTLKGEAAKLAEVFQRSSANVEGRNGYLSLRNHQLRGLDHPRKRACLTAVHNFFLTRPDGTTAAERFFGQKPRSMVAAMLESVEIPPAPLSPPRRAAG